MADDRGDPGAARPGEADSARGPEAGGLAWWLLTTAGFALTLLLMGVLAVALTMLTRMVVEGSTDVELHHPTFLVWFVVCILLIVVPMVGGTWRQLQGGSSVAPADPRPGAAAPEPVAPEPATAAQPAAPGARPAAQGPARSPGPRPTGPSPGDLIGGIGLVCLVAWLPLAVVLAVGLALLPLGIDQIWGLTAFLLLPVGWLLRLTGHVVRHRAQRSAWSRSDLAGFLAITGFVVVVLGCVLVLTLIIMRSLGGVLIATSVTIGAGWLVRSQLPHTLDSGEPSPSGSSETAWIDPDLGDLSGHD